ncbi:hypothetical protein DPMN_051115 [Dreissena polymorpha]|uniref:Reverse transcriptase n=1 Tax=Dreissena polymorpha TaxID=45954 RepID=A0A9D4CIF9_DREPO|nr:hypothetical protein DPMN_051115 [Dreissena polymorpha]
MVTSLQYLLKHKFMCKVAGPIVRAIQHMSRGAPGGVLSTEHYERFNNPLLLNLKERFRGASIGLIDIPHTTCADDLALLSHSDWQMNLMLKKVEEFSLRNRYDINPSKSPDPSPDFIL